MEKILIETEKEKLWRYSYKATYFVLDLTTRNFIPVSSLNKRLKNAKFSPNGKYVSYVREDNNIYVFNTKSLKEKQLTRTGNEKILNGHFGWLYEEELTGFDGYRWSPDSKYISFWEEDQSKVPEFSILDEINFYPTTEKIRYPKVGENNPSLRIGIARVEGAGKKMDKKSTCYR